jgi:acetyl coenzyme A synthetase (ADP forming)-like protein
MRQLAEHDHVLQDGTTVRIRPLGDDDAQRLDEMWSRVSLESHRHRKASRLVISAAVSAEDPDELAIVATLGRSDDEKIVGIARFKRLESEPDTAEIAVVVEDAHQGRGIATALLRHAASAAREAGIRRLTGAWFPDNERVRRLLQDLGLVHREIEQRDSQGRLIRTEFTLAETSELLEVVAADEKRAARAALRRFFEPRSIAVVGASRSPSSIGGLVFGNLVRGGYGGPVFPVNSSARVVQSVAAYASLSECPEVPDLMMVCVPARHVAELIDEAGQLGVRAACIISAGFSEAGESGGEMQRDVMERARAHGMRVIGPNCMGLLNGSGSLRMNATFSALFPAPGNIAVSSQSGALGLAVLRSAGERGLGISKFASVGNKADISNNDLLLYWEDDPETEVIVLYLESFGNPRTFSRIARRISRRKPIVAVKSGRTGAGRRAAASHTAALASGDVAVDALFRQAGVIRTDTLEELFDVATLLESQPLPAGRRVAILTNAGGPGILAADALESEGLEVPAFDEETLTKLREILPPEAGVSNPVDLIASGTAEQYGRVLEILGNSPNVDTLFVIFMPGGAAEESAVARAIVDSRRRIPEELPVVSVFMSVRGVPEALASASVPSFAFPEDAARSMGRVAAYSEWRNRPIGSIVRHGDLDPEGARRIIESALQSRPDDGAPPERVRSRRRSESASLRSAWLDAEEAQGVLACYGIPLARALTVSDEAEAVAALDRLGGPVAVKVAAAIHKSDVGGISLHIGTAEEMRAAIATMRARLGREGLGEHARSFIVQEMIEEGVEMVVGVSHDPSFGPVVMAGIGGTLVELIRDVSFSITPLTDRDVDEMLDALKTKPLLTGYRGSQPVDVGAFKDLLFRVSAMVEDLPEIAELDLNPVFVRPKGVSCVDVRMRAAASR